VAKLGLWHCGGDNSPYIWFKCPSGDSWAYFDYLLNTHQIVTTPGAGFGKNGEGFIRVTAFGSRENVTRAAERLLNV
jgi:LL-diaminopimelate aminotransferase